MTNRLLALAAISAVGAGSVATVAAAHQGRAKVASARVQIATISSYSTGKLTVKTTDGTTITGKVTRATDIDCRPLIAATPSPTATPAADAESTTPEEVRGGGHGRGDEGPGGRGPGRGARSSDEDEAVCDTSSLTAGTGVIAASTELTKTGQRFTRLVLVESTTTSSSSSSDSDYVS